MSPFEQLIGVLLVAVLLAAAARKIGAPYPAFLALVGAVQAFVPGAPAFSIQPEVALALFVAPVLLDAAYDASPRDLKDYWVAIVSLALVSVVLTTLAPDAAAATAVLRQLRPPHRILTILQGESLFNDASALRGGVGLAGDGQRRPRRGIVQRSRLRLNRLARASRRGEKESAARSLLARQDQTGAARASNEASGLIPDIALDQTDCFDLRSRRILPTLQIQSSLELLGGFKLIRVCSWGFDTPRNSGPARRSAYPAWACFNA